jgi:hypothetical protein
MDEEFMKELEQLTQTMQQEMAKETITPKPSDNTSKTSGSTPFGNFNMPFISEGNEDEYMKELQKLLMSGLNLDSFDTNDTQTAEMLKMLGNSLLTLEDNMKNLQDKVEELTQQQGGTTCDTTTFTDHNTSNNTKQKESNPFKDVFKEMNDSNSSNSLFNNLLSGLGNDLNTSETDQSFNSLGKLHDVLTKLSNKENDKGKSEPNQQELYHLFEDLIECLLKTEILFEPLSTIKSSLVNYLEKNKDKMEKEKEEKYKTMLGYIDTILVEISKPSSKVDKKLIIDILFKLNDVSDLDPEFMKDADPAIKQFSEMFKK